MNRIEVDHTNWWSVFSDSLGKTRIAQERCADAVIKGRGWQTDFSKGILSFGEDEYPVQFIGSESHDENTWLWSWSESLGMQDSIIEVAQEVRAQGEEWQLEPLTAEAFNLTDSFNGHTLSTVACAITERKVCYFRCPHEKGAAFVVFEGAPDEIFAPGTREEIIRVALDAIKSFAVDHRIFVESLLENNGVDFDWEGTVIHAHFEEECLFFFEAENGYWRLEGINTSPNLGE
ncbi:MAG: DUF6882 domain-containing protein [Raoultibacter sp.]|jgi:hypothetical protein